MNLAHTLINDYVICYRFIREPDCIKLKLWEPSPLPSEHGQSEHHYLYIINFSFSHLDDAEAFLRRYLLTNGAFDIPETDFPEEGQIAILPFPTWGMDQ
ncbi:MAG: hypothetical protein F6K42_31320 [Leptolyngbya sp. SIO1D8]|nr:hypothetical protein [Leptolyngbya sp. SIO1D8]